MNREADFVASFVAREVGTVQQGDTPHTAAAATHLCPYAVPSLRPPPLLLVAPSLAPPACLT